MKTFKIYTLGMLLSATLLTACTRETSEVNPGILQINATISDETSRVSADGSAFSENDSIGLFVTESSKPLLITGNHTDNRKHTYSGTAWVPASPVHWNDSETKINIFGYYPYQTITSITQQPITVSAVQTVGKTTGKSYTIGTYETSDFLYSNNVKNQGPQTKAIELTFGHVMSKIVINLMAGSGFETPAEKTLVENATISVENTIPNGTIDLSTGIFTLDATKPVQSINPMKLAKTDNFQASHTVILAPQRIATGKNFLVITVNGGKFFYDVKDTELELTGGHQRTLKITVNRTGLDVSVGNIENWKNDTGITDDAELQKPEN